MWYSLMSILKAFGQPHSAFAPPGAEHRTAVSAGRRRAAPSPAPRPRGSGHRTPCPDPPRGRQRRTQRRLGPGAAARLNADLFSAQPPSPTRPLPWQPRADAGPPERQREPASLSFPSASRAPSKQHPSRTRPLEPPDPSFRSCLPQPAPQGRPLRSLSQSRWGPVSPHSRRLLKALSPTVSLHQAVRCALPLACQCSPHPRT